MPEILFFGGLVKDSDCDIKRKEYKKNIYHFAIYIPSFAQL